MKTGILRSLAVIIASSSQGSIIYCSLVFTVIRKLFGAVFDEEARLVAYSPPWLLGLHLGENVATVSSEGYK